MDDTRYISAIESMIDNTRYVSTVKSYVQVIRRVWYKSKVPGPVALDILEIFAHNESLSTYQLFSKLKTSTLKMAYKNVHKIIQRLLALNLLTKTKKLKSFHNDNNHNAIYYKLSELGIFRLFLTRHFGIFADQLSIKEEKKPTLKMDKDFIRYYSNCKLFEAFLLPVIRFDSLRLLNEIFLLYVCDYLHQCCKEVESILRTENPNLPATQTICSWNEMLDKQIIDIRLLLSLRTKFDLEDIDLQEFIDDTKIKLYPEKKDELEICNTQFKIRMCLDKSRKKAMAMHLQNGRTHAYDIYEIGSDIQIVYVRPKFDMDIEIKFGMREQINSLVYRMISTIGIASQEQRSGFKELAVDETFSKLVEDAYAHFEQGRSVLLNLRV